MGFVVVTMAGFMFGLSFLACVRVASILGT